MKPKFKVGQLVNYTYSLGCYTAYRIEAIEENCGIFYYKLSNVAYSQPESRIIQLS